MSYHGLLDWRLGLSLLRVLSDSSYHCGLNGNFSTPDLADWPTRASELRDTFCASFGCTPVMFDELPGFQAGERCVVVVHPLWDCSKPTGSLARAAATVAPDDTLQFIDTFNMHRRMSWAYQALRG
jgi:hypothetical protein